MYGLRVAYGPFNLTCIRLKRYQEDSPHVAAGMKKEYKWVRMLTAKNQEMYMYGVGNAGT